MRRIALLLLLGVLLTAACAEDEPSYQKFRSELEGGASCARLFEIRNALDSKDPIIDRMNDELASVGCFSSSSDRMDSQ